MQQRPSNAPAAPAPPAAPDEAPVWLARAIDWAHSRGATDLHLFPSESEGMLWARLDGTLIEVARYPISVHGRMIARLKVMGRCSDYAGELLQEGRFTLNGSSAGGEARLSIVPTLRGEKAVLRLIAGGETLQSLDSLGLSDELIAAMRDAMDRPQGMILAIGPSGCGKSTALYAMLEDLHRRAGHPLSIVTIEDPVERSAPFAAQIGVEPERGVGFAAGLRAILRQDPEVIMIGEIRDTETAGAALQAALTGHRLLSSMHTLSAAEALVRLRQMGAPPYVIVSALAGIANLRLVRLLCPDCSASTEKENCVSCLGSGFRGRTGVGEWMSPTADTIEALREDRPTRGIAGTLTCGASAGPAAEALLAGGRIPAAESRRLTGLASLNAAMRSEGKSES